MYADQNGKCWPAIETLALQLGVSESKVSRTISALKAVGVIYREQKIPNKSAVIHVLHGKAHREKNGLGISCLQKTNSGLSYRLTSLVIYDKLIRYILLKSSMLR